jgi:hypothetical protein
MRPAGGSGPPDGNFTVFIAADSAILDGVTVDGEEVQCRRAHRHWTHRS